MKTGIRTIARFWSGGRHSLAILAVAVAFLAMLPPALVAHGAGPPGHLRERAFDVCFTAQPAGWAGAVRASFPTTLFAVAAVSPAGDRAYGYTVNATGDQGIAAVDLRTGALTALVDLPASSSGVISLAVDDRWMAWVQGDSVFNPFAWTVYARSLETGRQQILATSRLPDGTLLFGQQPLLALNRGVVTWAQPTSTTGPVATAEVRAYDLSTGRLSILDSGRVSSPVFAGTLMVWGRIGGDGATVFRAVDAATLRPVGLPEQVRSQPGIVYLAGSRHFLAWSTDWHHAVAWRLDGGQLTSYATSEAGDVFQFLTVAGHFLVWFAGSSFAVLDLETGGAFNAGGNGRMLDQLAGSKAVIVRSQFVDAGGRVPGTIVSSLRTATASDIPGCAA